MASPTYYFETLPVTVVGTVGQEISLLTILTTEFGANFGGYQDFYVGYKGPAFLHNEGFSYRNLNNEQVSRSLDNGTDIGPVANPYWSTPADIESARRRSASPGPAGTSPALPTTTATARPTSCGTTTTAPLASGR